MNNLRVVVIGATSGIAHATARCFAREGASFLLVARTTAKLESVAEDLKVYGASQVATSATDLADLSQASGLPQLAKTELGGVDIVLIAHGVLGDQAVTEKAFDLIEKEFQINFLSPVAFMTAFSDLLLEQQAGTLAVISSVAGDRGRQSNYVYGSTKAALTAFLSGLRGRLARHGIHVMTIKPGMVRTSMTMHLPNSPLMADPDKVGRAIYKGILARKAVLYVPGYWWFIMTVIKLLPEAIFKRLKF